MHVTGMKEEKTPVFLHCSLLPSHLTVLLTLDVWVFFPYQAILQFSLDTN